MPFLPDTFSLAASAGGLRWEWHNGNRDVLHGGDTGANEPNPFLSVAAVLPFSCARPLLEMLTPFVIDGSNGFMTDLIFAASPLVL